MSSFGFGGANAHVVLEEYLPHAGHSSADHSTADHATPDHSQGGSASIQGGTHAPGSTKASADDRPHAVLLSAREPETLRARARQLLDRLDAEGLTEGDLPRIAYTLQVGRDAMAERLACVTRSLPELRTQLRQFLDGERPAGVRTGRADRRSMWNDLVDDEDITAAIGNWMSKGKLDRLLKLWVAGAEFDWRQLWGEHPPRRIPLPTYPFRLERYWIADGTQEPDAVSYGAEQAHAGHETGGHEPSRRRPAGYPPAGHGPAGHGPDSTGSAGAEPGDDQGPLEYRRLLGGEEYFLRDHRVRGVPTLPGAAYPELVRAAFGPRLPAAGLRLRDVQWLRPLQVASPCTVSVRVEPGDGTYEVHAGEGAGRTVYARGTVTAGVAGGEQAATAAGDSRAASNGDGGAAERRAPAHDVHALRDRCPDRLDGAECYERFESLGLSYGPALRALEELHYGAGTAVARLSLPGAAAATQTPEPGDPGDPEPGGSEPAVLNPSMLDAAFQAGFGVFLGERAAEPGAAGTSAAENGAAETGATALPFAVREVRVFAATPAAGWAVARPAEGDRPGGTLRTLDVDLCDSAGEVCVRFEGFSLRTVPGDAAGRAPAERSLLMIEPAWSEAEAAETAEGAAAGAAVADGTAPARRAVLCELPGIDAGALAESLNGECEAWQAAGDVAARYTDYARRLLELLQREVRGPSADRGLIQLVTPSAAPWLGGLSAMLRTARQEHPGLLVQWIEARGDESPEELSRVLRSEGADPNEVTVRHGDGRRRVSRWRETPLPDPRMPWRDGGVYLFTGGSGGLAALFAKDAARRVRGPVLILTGRSPAGPGQRELLAQLRSLGAQAEYRVLDVSDSDAVGAAVRDVTDGHGALHGIVHAAGVLRDGFIARKSPEELSEVFAAKVAGLQYLDEASADVELDFLIAFSSMAAFGNAGQADYAAANAFMDGYARHRESLRGRGGRHGRTLSVNWPLWERGGMRGGARTEALLKDVGMRPMQEEIGLDALYRAWASGLPSVLVLEGDPGRMRERLLPSEPQEPATAERSGGEVAGGEEGEGSPSGSDRQAHARAPLPSADGVGPRVAAVMSSLLEIGTDALPADAPLREYGLDSIFLTQFLARARKEFDSSLTLDAIAGCETLQDFTEEIERSLRTDGALPHEAAAPPPGGAGTGQASRSLPGPVPAVHPVAKAPDEFPELIPMNAVREGRPVFWIHHGNGGVESYAPVAERCGRPFYGIQPRGWTGSEDILTGQEAMASYYADIIRAVQPEGPYDLGGFSLGGLFAYEVVRQLQLQGAEVDTLVMLDTLDASSTNQANALMTGGSFDPETVSKVSAFRAVNLMLGNNSLDPGDGAPPVLHRDGVDTALDPGPFLDSLVDAAVARGVHKTPAQLRARVQQLARYFEAVHGEKHQVRPLPRRDEVRCYYLRNEGGKFFGPFEEYMVLFPDPGLPAVDGTAYWREWAESIDDFLVIDVGTQTHAEVMTEPAALKKVLRLCDRLYAPGQGGR